MKGITFFLFLLVVLPATAQEAKSFICEQGNETVKLEFENNSSSLAINTPTKLKVFVENIDRKKSSILGRGIRPLGNNRQDEFFLCQVTVDKESVVEGYYKIIFSYTPVDGGERKVCTFLIPVK